MPLLSHFLLHGPSSTRCFCCVGLHFLLMRHLLHRCMQMRDFEKYPYFMDSQPWEAGASDTCVRPTSCNATGTDSTRGSVCISPCTCMCKPGYGGFYCQTANVTGTIVSALLPSQNRMSSLLMLCSSQQVWTGPYCSPQTQHVGLSLSTVPHVPRMVIRSSANGPWSIGICGTFLKRR